MNATASLDRLRDAYAAYHRAYTARAQDGGAQELARRRLDLALVLSQEDELPDGLVDQVAQDARLVLEVLTIPWDNAPETTAGPRVREPGA